MRNSQEKKPRQQAHTAQLILKQKMGDSPYGSGLVRYRGCKEHEHESGHEFHPEGGTAA